MGAESMFHLDDQLREWSSHFSQTESMCHGDVEELENHIRDSVEALTSNGLNTEEAFLVATYRLGDSDTLGGEYRKAIGHCVWGRRAFWMAAGCLIFELLRSLFAMVASLGQVLATLAGANGTEMSFVSFGVGLVCCGWIATWAVRWHLNNEHASSARARAVLNWNGWVIGGGLALAVLTAKLIQAVSYMVIVRTSSIDELGRAAEVQMWSSSLLVVLLPAGNSNSHAEIASRNLAAGKCRANGVTLDAICYQRSLTQKEFNELQTDRKSRVYLDRTFDAGQCR